VGGGVSVRRMWGIGGPIIGFFLIGGFVFWMTIPDIFIGQIWVGVSVLLILVYLVIGGFARRRAALLLDGIPGSATVLSVEQTGVYINQQPQVRLRMRVEAPGVEPYEVERSEVVPIMALGAISGGQLSVAIDPEDPDNVAVDWSTVAAPMTLSMPDGRVMSVDKPAARAEVMATLREHGVGVSGEVSVRENAAARRAVWEILARHGYDVDPRTGGPRASSAPQVNQVDALAQLAEMRDRKLITDAEFELKKREILSEL
jgi:hypothetical protein